LVLQITREVDQELNSYDRHFSDHTPGYAHSMVDDEETGGAASSTTAPDDFYDDEDDNSSDSENWSSW
jgi:mannosyltransferase OCH1-like enzyme